jgi:hypothetical protein
VPVNFHRIGGHIHGNIGVPGIIIDKILFNDVRFIPGEDYEFVKPPIGIQLHDMPENRPSANFYHGLGAQIRFFGEAGTISSGEEYYFHDDISIKPLGYDLLIFQV